MFLLIYCLYILFNNFNNVIYELINIVILIDFILIGGVFPLLERKYLALIQRRIGPKYVGYKGRLQFIADAIKVFFKDYFYLFRVNKYFFIFIPMVFFNINLYFMINFIWGDNNIFLFDIELNVLYVLILTAMSNFMVFLVGFFCRNKYTVIASSRAVQVFFANELLLTILICQYLFFTNSFSFSSMLLLKNEYIGIFFFLSYLPIIIFIFLLDINRVPFDYLEAESELIMGYTNEYTGFLFGVFVLIEYLHIFFFSYFIVILFF